MADSQESADAYEYQKAHLSDNKKAEIIAPTVIFLAIAYTAVFLRYKSRRIARITLKADDWCIGLALITTTCFIIVYYLGIKYGMGRHEILITDPKAWVIIIVSTQVLYSISICTIKLSILFLYDRIFGTPKPMFRHILRAMGGFVIAYGVAGTLGTILQCVPLSDLWKPPSNGPPVCIDFGTLVITMGVLNIVTDITILGLPIPLAASAYMENSSKMQPHPSDQPIHRSLSSPQKLKITAATSQARQSRRHAQDTPEHHGQPSSVSSSGPASLWG
ncbi:hypothetical protein HO133_009291 [Letharia lupina]|uniref:Rhodopsin domain-containing protein n=1 Tax=Letharia lupina TaxID=560253 RepID=A0A8H6CML2_9LECA|nr:uncharacterized protein HO133_009291 [Letharia lupina]KAF6226425.1 hypothetical protein HO133_009291 [Letharia lupina]